MSSAAYENEDETVVITFFDGLTFFNDEVPKSTYFETLPICFTYNPFKFASDSVSNVQFTRFTQPVRDFYLQDYVASSSITRADCALYLNQQTNFSKEL